MTDSGPPFSSKEFNSFLSGLGIKHTTSSPNYPQSNGFIERQIQTVKRPMEKANSTGRSFQEALTGLRATPISEGMPSPAEILHGRSLVTRKAISVDLTAVWQHLIALQAKYIKQHDKARWARSQRTLVAGEEVYHLTSGNNWVIGIVSGTRDSGRSYDILTEGRTTLRRNRSHLKPRSHDIPMLNQDFTCRTTTPSQSEIFHSGPAHLPKEKYTAENCNDMKYSLISEPEHPPKEKYSQIIKKLVIRCIGDTAYDHYITETLVPLRSAFKPRKQTRFERDPVTSIRHIPVRCSKETSPPKRTINPDQDLLMPIELSQASTGICVQDLRDLKAGEATDTAKAHSPPSQPCGQIPAQRNDNKDCDRIAHFRTNASSQSKIYNFRTTTPSQSEIFSPTSHNNNYNNSFKTIRSSQSEIFSETSNSISIDTGTETDNCEEYNTPSQSESEATSSASNSETSRTITSSQSEISMETSTEYDASSEASSRETSRPSSPESGNMTVRSVYSPLPEMAILHKSMHDAIHAVREQQGRAVTRTFFQQQQEVAANNLKCMSQIQKTSTPDPPPPKKNAFPRRPRARSEMVNGTTSGSSEESDCENPRKAKFLALKRQFKTSTSSNEETVKHARFPSRTSTPSQKWQCCRNASCEARSWPGLLPNIYKATL